MFKLVLEIIFTILFVISLITSIVTSSWLFVVLDAIIVVLGIVNSILTFRNWRHKGRKDT